ncbi:MAG TPA: hypothetical protein DC054_11825 [Blastocatellia bacterium]|nr:hypothetical protein [Blastocatellia bacterium]
MVQGQPWYLPTSLADNYPLVTKNLLQPKHNRKQFFLSILNPDVPASSGYERLAEFMFLPHVRTVLTTNFDRVLVDLCRARKRPRHINVIETPSDHTKLSTGPDEPQIAYLHGSVDHYTDKNDLDEIQEMDKALAERLTPILRDHPLIVIGYRGAEPSIMQHLLTGHAEQADNYKHGIYWRAHRYTDSKDLHPLVHELANTIGINFQVVVIESFDELMKEFWSLHEQRTADVIEERPIISEKLRTAAPTFDMESMSDVTIDALEWATTRTRIVNYCQEMRVQVPAQIDRDWIVQRLVQFDLAVHESEKRIVPTKAGYLLFNSRPQDRIGVARVRLQYQDDEQIIDGNLWTQLERIINALAELNRPFILKEEVSQTVYPYPPTALREIIVNALVHRTYHIEQDVVIRVKPDHIQVTNPGGLIEDVVRQAGGSTLEEHIKRGRRGIKGYRNPVIADLFYSAGDMEKKGSGLADVVRLVADNEGHVDFGPIAENTSFQVTIYARPEAVDATTGTATPLVVATKFAANLLELLDMPSRAWCAETPAKRVKDVWGNASVEWMPPFIVTPPRLVTFFDLNDRNNPLRNQVDRSTTMHGEIDELFEGDRRNHLVWLLNESIYRHLAYRGLVVDKKRRRAYFPRSSAEDGRRVITYQSRLRKPTRTVTKPIVSQASGKVRYWEHESFSFVLDQFDDTWALQIVPGYVFTLNGVAKLLEGDKVNKLSTKRASRDYNSQVHNDLVFWSWVISGGQPGSFQLVALPRPRTLSGGANEDEIAAENEVQELANQLTAPRILFRSQIPTINVTNLPAEAEDEATEELTEREREYREIEEELAAIADEQETQSREVVEDEDQN